ARWAGGVEGHGPESNALRAAETAASTSAAAARGTLPTYSPVAGQCTSMTSDVDGAVHLPPMKSLSYSVVRLSVICAAPPHRSVPRKRDGGALCIVAAAGRAHGAYPTQPGETREHVAVNRPAWPN